jgi:hypothetical protein
MKRMVSLTSGRTVVQVVACIIAILCLILSQLLLASSLSPRGTKYEQHVSKEHSSWFERTAMALAREGALHFAEPVHEEITTRIFGCDGDEGMCGDPDMEFAGPFDLAGVRWNDDPPFQLQPDEGQNAGCKTTETIRFTTQPRCWYQLFKAAKRQAISGEVPDASNHAPLLARSHFGDLQFLHAMASRDQFLHAMASRDGETAGETRKRVLMWAEFTWKISTEEYSLNTKLQDINIAGFDNFFGKSGWTVQDLFTVGNPALRPHLYEVALGSILHTLEDSFARGHVQREYVTVARECSGAPQLLAPGRIVEFHSYAHQDGHKHAEFDKREAFEQGTLNDKPDVVLVGRQLLDFYNNNAKWETVRPYFECVFAIVDDSTPATAGEEFTKTE